MFKQTHPLIGKVGLQLIVMKLFIRCAESLPLYLGMEGCVKQNRKRKIVYTPHNDFVIILDSSLSYSLWLVLF
jgi:hypothetical protein